MAGIKYFITAILVVYGVSQLRAEEPVLYQGDFNVQVKEILDQRQLKPEHYAAVEDAVESIERLLQTKWPDVKLFPFGSVFTGLGSPDSDIDFYVHLSSPHSITTLVEEAASFLRDHPEVFANVRCHGKRIPKASALHLPSRREIDLTFSRPTSVRNTKLVAYLLRDSTVSNLTKIIKYWTTIHNLDHDVTHYFFTLMVIFFLQHKGILPAIADLQKDVPPLMLDHWDTAFEYKMIDPPNEELSVLLGEFFEYYAHFDFGKNVVSPFAGYPIGRARFLHFKRLPKTFELYKYNMANNMVLPFDLTSPIAVQDVFEHSRSVGQKLGEVSATRIKTAIQTAYDAYLANEDPGEFLNQILRE